MKARLSIGCWRCRHVLQYDYCDAPPDSGAFSITCQRILPSLVSLSSLKDDSVALVECAGMRLSPVR
jgi:hypothetical protein